MKNKHVIDLLPAYIDGVLAAEQQEAIALHLKDCELCSEELNAMKTLLKAFDDEPIIQPSTALKVNFYDALEREKIESTQRQTATPKSLHPRKKLWTMVKVAASIAFLISAFLLGRYQNLSATNPIVSVPKSQQETSKTALMLALMDDLSASKRIQGVTTVNEFEHPDETIVNALIERMLEDQNTNVRLTAIQVLMQFTSSETVKNAFVKALKSEKEPLLQIRIIKTLVKIQEKKAIAPMRFLLEQKDTEPFVKEQLKSLLPTIL